jgi:hypothetical protein
MDAIFCEREISFLLMPNSADPAQILDEVLGGADALIRVCSRSVASRYRTWSSP